MIMFATKGGLESLDGFPYALDLARSLKKGLAVLIIESSRITGAFEEAMIAATFAEANGTRLNGKKITARQPYPLTHEDVLSLGKFKVQVLIQA